MFYLAFTLAHRAIHAFPLKLLEKLDAKAGGEKTSIIREAVVELKLELRSLYSSLDAISSNDISASQLRCLEGIRHLLTNFAERARALEEEIGDPFVLAQDIVAENVSARVSGARRGRTEATATKPNTQTRLWTDRRCGCETSSKAGDIRNCSW